MAGRRPPPDDRESAVRDSKRGCKGLRPLQQLRADMQQLRADIQQLREDMNRQDQQLREDMNRHIQQLREDMNQQFARQFRLTLAVLGAFTALVVAIIGFALWDRRTMIRPFERVVKSLEEDLSANRQRVEALRSLRSLGQRTRAPTCSTVQYA